MPTSPKKTVGQYAYELQQKKDEKINPIDLQREVHKGNSSDDSYENQVRMAVDRGRAEFGGNFYVVVLFKKERLLQNVIRQYFFPRRSCPTPEYDQVLYRYHCFDDKLEFIWVIPDKGTVEALPLISKDLTPEQKEFYQYILDFRTGKLDKICEKLNNSPLKNLIVVPKN